MKKTLTLITLTLTLIALTITTSYAKSISSMTRVEPTAHQEIGSNYQYHKMFYRGSLEDPKAVAADLKGGLEFNTKKQWKEGHIKQETLSKMKPYKITVEVNKTKTMEGYIFIQEKDKKETYDPKSKVGKGYFYIEIEKVISGGGGAGGGGAGGGAGGGEGGSAG